MREPRRRRPLAGLMALAVIAGIVYVLWPSETPAPQGMSTGILLGVGGLGLAVIAIARTGIIEVLDWIWAALEAIGSMIMALVNGIWSLFGWD